jgi:hypothetical protein
MDVESAALVLSQDDLELPTRDLLIDVFRQNLCESEAAQQSLKQRVAAVRAVDTTDSQALRLTPSKPAAITLSAYFLLLPAQ